MERIEVLTNIERAKILHELFPAEIPNLLHFVSEMSETIVEEEKTIAKSWKNEDMPLDKWLSVAVIAARLIRERTQQFKVNSSLFAYWLFEGDAAQYLIYCLLQYTIPRRHPNTKFFLTVQLLFT